MGLMFGLAIGDAMGAPIEFEDGREPDDYITKYMTGGAHGVSKGEFTDDTSMALAMAEAFIEAGGLAPGLIMDNFLKWKNYVLNKSYLHQFHLLPLNLKEVDNQ